MTVGPWIVVLSEADHKRALKLAKDDYQKALLTGEQAWSGSTVVCPRGRWSWYTKSRQILLGRLTNARIRWRFERQGPHRKKILILGEFRRPTAFERILTEPSY